MSPPTTPSEHDLPAAFAGLSTRVDGLASDLAEYAKATNEQIRETNASLREFASNTNASIQALGLRQEESRRTPWSTLAAWAGVVLGIGGVFGSIVMSRIDGVQARADAISTKAMTDAYDFGRRDAEITQLQAELDRVRNGGKAP